MLLGFAVFVGALVQQSNGNEATTTRARTASPGIDPIESQCWDELRSAVHEQQSWIKVHASEFLVALGEPAEIERLFLIEEEEHGEQSQYRIGIWRVLAQTVSDCDRQKYIDCIIAAAIEEGGPDRVHAIESLAKLAIPLKAADRERLRLWTEAASAADSAYGHWWLARTAETEAERSKCVDSLTSLLASEDAQVRHRAAYAIARLDITSGKQIESILAVGLAAAERSPLTDADRLADAHVMIAAWRLAESASITAAIMRQGVKHCSRGNAACRRTFADALATLGDESLVPDVAALLCDRDADVRCSAAHAVLKIRQKR